MNHLGEAPTHDAAALRTRAPYFWFPGYFAHSVPPWREWLNIQYWSTWHGYSYAPAHSLCQESKCRFGFNWCHSSMIFHQLSPSNVEQTVNGATLCLPGQLHRYGTNFTNTSHFTLSSRIFEHAPAPEQRRPSPCWSLRLRPLEIWISLAISDRFCQIRILSLRIAVFIYLVLG